MEYLNKKNIFNENQISELLQTLTQDWVGVLPTDTIYGLSGLVFSQEAIKRIYQIKKRNYQKPLIVLINSLKDLEIFKVELNDSVKNKLNEVWPGKISVILKCCNNDFNDLYCGGNSLAFRMPDYNLIQEIIKKTGPIVSTSANIEGAVFAKNIKEAQNYFNKQVDFYLNAGELTSQPSKILEIKSGKVIKIR